jgi:hypothetical protein
MISFLILFLAGIDAISTAVTVSPPTYIIGGPKQPVSIKQVTINKTVLIIFL